MEPQWNTARATANGYKPLVYTVMNVSPFSSLVPFFTAQSTKKFCEKLSGMYTDPRSRISMSLNLNKTNYEIQRWLTFTSFVAPSVLEVTEEG